LRFQYLELSLFQSEKQLTTVNYRYIVGLEERVNPADNSKDLVGYFNNQPFHAPPVALNFITNALLKKTNYTVKASNFPLPYTAVDEFKDIGSILTVGFQLG
jgi:ATP-binding cassette subfamily A (ABC1) protein 3